MISLDYRTLAQEVHGELANSRFGAAEFRGVSIDSRAVSEQQLFIAIRGVRDDGHKYIRNILNIPGVGLMVRRGYEALPELYNDLPVVIVEDTHQAMRELARGYRRRLKCYVIAVTGSNGKTTTKEFIYAMIASRFKSSYRSQGNLNNLYGLPLTIFAMPSDTRYAVFELGISLPDEMTGLATIAEPDLALITNVGPTHLETLGTVENVAAAKFELVDFLSDDKPVVLNADSEPVMQAAAKRKRKFITYGIKNQADFMARPAGISEDGFPLVEIERHLIKVPLFGEHQAYNLLAGYAVSRVLGIDITPADLDRIDYRFAPYRGEIENINGVTVIADCYNANPVSMKSGLRSFHHYMSNPTLAKRRSVVTIGDMLELGEKSAQYHADIGKLLGNLRFDMVLAVGQQSREIVTGAIDAGFIKERILHFENTEQAGDFLIDNVRRGDIVYLKASRGIGLEKLITLLKGSAFRQN